MEYKDREANICAVYVGKNSYIDSIVYRLGYPNPETDYGSENPYVDFARVDFATLLD